MHCDRWRGWFFCLLRLSVASVSCGQIFSARKRAPSRDNTFLEYHSGRGSLEPLSLSIYSTINVVVMVVDSIPWQWGSGIEAMAQVEVMSRWYDLYDCTTVHRLHALLQIDKHNKMQAGKTRKPRCLFFCWLCIRSMIATRSRPCLSALSRDSGQTPSFMYEQQGRFLKI